MENKKATATTNKFSRHNMIQNSREKFYANLNQVYVDNKDIPVL